MAECDPKLSNLSISGLNFKLRILGTNLHALNACVHVVCFDLTFYRPQTAADDAELRQ